MCFQTPDDSNENITIPFANRAVWGLKVPQKDERVEEALEVILSTPLLKKGHVFVCSYKGCY